MHNLHDRHRSGAERNSQDAPLRQEDRHDYQVEEEEGYSEDFPGIGPTSSGRSSGSGACGGLL